MDLEFSRRFQLESYPEKRRLIRGYIAIALLAVFGGSLLVTIWTKAHHSTHDQVEMLYAADSIRYLDEIMTITARLAAATGEPQWETRYHAAAAQLDKVLDRALAYAPEAVDALNQISSANTRVLGREAQALSLVGVGKRAEAAELLQGPGYAQDEATYAAGLQRLLGSLKQAELDADELLHRELAVSAGLTVTLLALLGYALYSNHRLLVRRIELEQALGVVARRLIGADTSRLDAEIQAALRLLAGRAGASQVWLLQAQLGPMPRLKNSWVQTNISDGAPDPRDITKALLACRLDEQGILTLQDGAGETWRKLGVSALEGVSLDASNQRFVLALLGFPGTTLRWNHREAAILQSFGEVMVRAIANRTLQEQLLHLATTDGLTSLSNRRQFSETLQREWSRAADAPLPTALLMIDIDHFKAINDRYGHAAGDAVLVKLAQLLRQHLRDIDVVGRIGGEEFAVLLPGTEAEAAVEVAERLRTQVASAAQSAEGQDIHLTVSIGVTLIDRRDVDAQAALKRADRALYAAKNAGRNRVEHCPAA